jgi:hypothetical protein
MRISIEDEEEMENNYDNDKHRKGAAPYAAFNDTR